MVRLIACGLQPQHRKWTEIDVGNVMFEGSGSWEHSGANMGPAAREGTSDQQEKEEGPPAGGAVPSGIPESEMSGGEAKKVTHTHKCADSQAHWPPSRALVLGGWETGLEFCSRSGLRCIFSSLSAFVKLST